MSKKPQSRADRADIVVGGGVDLFRSTNGGVNLVQISNWSNAPTSAYADHHVVVPHPAFNGTTNKIVFFGTDGGLYRANDVYTASTGGGWTALNNNLGITQFYGVAINPTTGAFPCGAVVPGINDGPRACRNLHERLNVNTNGCRLPLP